MRKLGYTTETFIAKAKKMHPDKNYDYSLTVYTGSKNKVKVICLIHGVFEIVAAHLIRKQAYGCHKCGGTKLSGLEGFIKKSIKRHGNKYIYDNVNYTNNNVKVEIICPLHGSFWQLPRGHVSGSGCPSCGNMKSAKSRRNRKIKNLSKKEIIERIRKRFGDEYDLSQLLWNRKERTIQVGCKTHGFFRRNLENFIKSKGCAKCNNQAKLDQDDFVRRCTEIFGGKYSYDKTVYDGNRKKVIITCPIHGDFEMIAGQHLKKSECPKCVGVHNHTTEEWVVQVNIVHNNKYTYDKTDYTIGKDKVTITCPLHGDFEQTASTHLSGSGCPTCRSSKGERQISAYFDNKNLIYSQEHTFEDCKHKSYLRYDFYLEDYNLLIEYHGIQHYEAVDFYGGEEQLKHRQKRDIIKEQYAKDNNINLLVIPYTDYDRIEEILDIYIQKLANDKKS